MVPGFVKRFRMLPLFADLLKILLRFRRAEEPQPLQRFLPQGCVLLCFGDTNQLVIGTSAGSVLERGTLAGEARRTARPGALR